MPPGFWLIILGLSSKTQGQVITTIGSQEVTYSNWIYTSIMPDSIRSLQTGVYYVIFIGVRLDNSQAELGFVPIQITPS
jgi:hypothetical protein